MAAFLFAGFRVGVYLAAMRKDMSKVIVERPRTGRSAGDLRAGRTRALLDDDDEPLRARTPVRTKPLKTKRLNENLQPLKRYLAANVGRSWNKVFSEISEHLKPTSTVQQHVRDHLEDFVAVKTRMKAGVVMASGHYFGGERTLEDDNRLYYVHPRTGLLKANPNRKTGAQKRRDKLAAEAAERAKRMREIDAKTQAHLFDGVWWEIKLARTGDNSLSDVVLASNMTTLLPYDLYGRHDVRARAKRILSKAEKKKLGLR